MSVDGSPRPWKVGAPYGALQVEVVDAEGQLVCVVRIKKYDASTWSKPVAWPQGEANLALILEAGEEKP